MSALTRLGHFRGRLRVLPQQQPLVQVGPICQSSRPSSSSTRSSVHLPESRWARPLIIGAIGAALGGIGVWYTLQDRSVSTSFKNVKPEYDFEAALQDLRSEFRQDQVSTSQADTDAHVSGWSYETSYPHKAIVYPESTEEVSRAVKLCAVHGVPITPYAGGTSLESQTSAPVPSEDSRSSICIDLGRMNKILRLSVADEDVTVQAGLGWEDLNAQLVEQGAKLFFPIDPGPTARIGGMAATGCSGTNAVHFGTMRGDYVLSLEVVLPNGEVINTRSRARKSSAGPDLTKLFVGSEGTLGIITAATLRLAPIRPNAVAVASFNSIDEACAAANALLAAGVTPQCLEMISSEFAAAINRGMADDRSGRQLPGEGKPSLFIKFVGASSEHLQADWKVAKPLLAQMGGEGLEYVDKQEEMTAIWGMRKLALMYAQQFPESPYPGDRSEDLGPWRFLGTDVCVPVSQLPELVRRVQRELEEKQILGPILGHVGDGNFHAGLMWRAEDHEKEKAVKSVMRSMVHHAQDLGGTCTGEHGVGLGKRAFLPRELGEGTVSLLRQIKGNVLDPLNIMNPGKLLPPEDIQSP